MAKIMKKQIFIISLIVIVIAIFSSCVPVEKTTIFNNAYILGKMATTNGINNYYYVTFKDDAFNIHTFDDITLYNALEVGKTYYIEITTITKPWILRVETNPANTELPKIKIKVQELKQ